MGFFDKFKPKHGQAAKKPRHVVSEKEAKAAAEAAKKKLWQSVPSADNAQKSEMKDLAESTKTAPEAKTKSVKPAAVKGDTGLAYRILIKPIVTEKTSRLASVNQYAFSVHPQATKRSVQSAVQAVYGIKPVRVNISLVSGRSVRYGRAVGRTKAWKKAVVSLPAGESIDIYGT